MLANIYYVDQPRSDAKTSKLMLLLPGSNLAKLLLRNPSPKALQADKDLRHILLIEDLALGLPDQRLDLHQALGVEVVAETLLHLLHNLGKKTLIFVSPSIKNLVDESNLDEFFCSDALAHDQSFIGFADAETLNKGAAGSAFCDETKRGERREEEGVRCSVDEIAESDKGRGETDHGAIEGRDEDFGVSVEGPCDVEVVDHESVHSFSTGISTWLKVTCD